MKLHPSPLIVFAIMSSPGWVDGSAQNFSNNCGIRVVEGRFLPRRRRWWLALSGEGTPARLLIPLLHMQNHKERQLLSIPLVLKFVSSAVYRMYHDVHMISIAEYQDLEDI